ncbi:MAG: T9SS type A sorting domain-containing protein, partial [Chlorobi bacterium]|nr:T9SS type A sorting domain-containing protein [Chlorobiota bacterium]
QIHYQRIYLIKADNETPRNIYCTTNYESAAIKFVDTFTVTGINEPDNIQPERFFLSQNYPNPFNKGFGGNPTTTIDYLLKENGFVQLKVYDVLGKEVISLVNEEKPAGNYSVKFDMKTLPSGVYIYALRVNDFMQSRKMILMK